MNKPDQGPERRFLLAFRQTTRKGSHYFGVNCAGCSEPLLRLPAPHKDARWPSVIVSGKMVIPCHRCETDGAYAVEDLRVFEAQEDFTSTEDARIKPSGSGRKPFLRKKETMRLATMGIGAIERRPEAARLVARCISHWTSVETSASRLLARMMRADNEPAIALYLSLKNARAKAEALDAVAHSQLDPRDKELLEALLFYKDTVEGQRNDIAHGVFGVSDSYKDGLLWMTTTHFATYQARVHAGVTPDLTEWLHKRLFVYEPADLETLAREIENLNTQIGFFTGYLESDNHAWRSARYDELRKQPGIQAALHTLKRRKEKK